MATAFHVSGAALVQVGTGTLGALETLGYTANGVDITLETHIENIPCDDNGGEQGPPAELNHLGDRATVRLEFTKWDETIADKLRCRLRGGTAGTVPTPGTLVFTNSLSYRLLVNTTNQPYNFPRAVPRSPITINKGTRSSRLILEFECYKDGTSVLYNASTT